MASPRKNADERLVSRTYRAAIRIGEDFITLEETITLPLDASDEEVTQAVDLGWRIYRAQREAVEGQIAGVRESVASTSAIVVRDPDAPASDKQRNYIVALQEDLAWTSEQLVSYAEEQNVDLVTMTKGQASTFIDGLKRLAEERQSYTDGSRGRMIGARPETQPNNGAAQSSRQVEGGPVHEKQLHALERLAQLQGVDLDMEARRRYGVVAHGMTYDQASSLLREWQRPNATKRTVGEPAL